MRVNKEKLLGVLEAVKAGLTSSEVAEHTDCFVFRDGIVYTYNDEVACEAPSPLGKAVQGAVKAGLLLEILRRMVEEELEVQAQSGLLYVKGKKRLSKFRLETDVSPTFGQIDPPTKWRKLPTDFNEAVALVQNCTGTDETRINTVCIHLHKDYVEAFDNFQLCRWELPTGFKDPILLRQLALKYVPVLGMSEFGETQSWVHFRNPDGVKLACRRYLEDDYPDLGKILNQVGDCTPLALPKGLSEAVERAALFSKENGEDANLVCVELSSGKVRVKADGVSGGYSESKRSQYKGGKLTFHIKPKILSDVLTRHNDCQVNGKWLYVKSSAYEYLACLTRPEDLAAANGEVEDTSDE